MEILETSRLRLVPFTRELKTFVIDGDTASLAQQLKARVPADWPGPDLADALPFLLSLMGEDGETWDGIIIHKSEDVVVGDIGFKGGPDERGAVEIGYSILPAYRRQGYATEMARGLIAWAFQQPAITTVTAECLADNLDSIRVLEKLGLQRLGPKDDLLLWELHK